MATVTFPEIFNNGLTLLNGAISDSIVTVIVDSAVALGLDDSTTDAYITIIAPSTFGFNPFLTPETLEVVQVTAVSSNTLTVTRGVDGTTGVAFGDNAYVMTRNNAATLQRVYDALTDGTDSLNIDALITGGSISAGNDLSFEGDLTNGTTGVDKLWSKWISAGEMQAAGSATVGIRTVTSGDTVIVSLNFDQTSAENASVGFCLPSDYDGSALTYDIYWTSASGTGGVHFQINHGIYTDQEDLSTVAGGVVVTKTSGGADILNISSVSGTPTGATAGDTFLTVLLRRQTGDVGDTLTADCEVLGIKISYT